MINKDKLDDLFLFVLGLGIVEFTFVQESLSGFTGLIDSLPVLLSAIALPLYVGFFRGSVVGDSRIDRLRGWVMLVVGNFVMLGVVVNALFNVANLEYGIAAIGLIIGGAVGWKFSNSLGISWSSDLKIIIGCSEVVAYLFPVVIILLESVFALVLLGIRQLAVVTLESTIGFGTLISILMLVVAHRTSYAFRDYQTRLEDFDQTRDKGWQKRLDRDPFLNSLNAVVRGWKKKKLVRSLIVCSMVSILVALALLENHAILIGIFLSVYFADIFLTGGIVMYLKIPRDQIILW